MGNARRLTRERRIFRAQRVNAGKVFQASNNCGPQRGRVASSSNLSRKRSDRFLKALVESSGQMYRGKAGGEKEKEKPESGVAGPDLPTLARQFQLDQS